jgi:hypothetical protein
MPGWYWLFEPIILGTSSYLPLPSEVYWFATSYPKLSAVLLAVGLAATLYRRTRQLWWFAAPVLLSGALHGLAFVVGDSFSNFGPPLVLTTLTLGLVLTVYAFVKSRSAWPAGILFATNSLIILAYQGLLSVMILTGSAI